MSFPSPRRTSHGHLRLQMNARMGMKCFCICFLSLQKLCFDVSDPQHVQAIVTHLSSGGKLNNHYLFKLCRKGATIGKLIDSKKLMPLLNPKPPCLIIPEGKLFSPVRMDSHLLNGEFQKIILEPNCAKIRYVDGKAKEHMIEVPKIDGQYTYEEISTPHLYELFVRTSIFSKVFGDFPQQIIAFTEQNVRSTPIDQPWFFGAMFEEEASEILADAGVYPVFLTRSEGSRIFTTCSSSKRSNNHTLSYGFDVRSLAHHLSNMPPRFFGAVYNQGMRKNMLVYETYVTVVSKPLDQIIKFINDNKIDLTSQIYQRVNIAVEYLSFAPHFDFAILEYLLDQGAAHDTRMMFLMTDKTLDEILRLIKRGVQMDGSSAYCMIVKRLKDTNTFPKLEDCEAIFNAIANPDERPARALMGEFFEALTGETYKITYAQSKSKILTVKMAWKFGENNLFKKLPKELVDFICSFVNRPDWWNIAEYLTSHAVIDFALPHNSYLPYRNWLPVLPFVWQYWNRFSPHNIFTTSALFALQNFCAKEPHNAKQMVDWCAKFITRTRNFRVHTALDATELFSFIMETECSVPLLDAILKFAGDMFPLHKFSYLPSVPDHRLSEVTPTVWVVAVLNNRPVLKYLIDKGHLHFNDPANSFARLEDLIKTHGKDSSVLDYIKQLIFDKDPTATTLQRKI